jgi:mannosyl-3-phosphoglycerate phosphatase
LAPPFIVYTDLDGTLLDHDSYDWSPAAEMLSRLGALGVPVVIVTSKTRPEVLALREAIGNAHPFIVENGAVTLIPEGYFDGDRIAASDAGAPLAVHRAGPARSQLLAVVTALREREGFRFRTFTELGSDTVAALTGLPPAAAALANRREGSEPLLWEDSEAALRVMREALEDRGLACVRGGRFVHVMGPTDKAAAVAALHDRFERCAGTRLERIVLGDGPNDLAMLADADVAVVVRAVHAHPMPLEARGQVLKTRATGPRGWAEAMARVLRDRELVPKAATE